MATPYYRRPVLAKDNDDVKWALLHGTPPGHLSLLQEPQTRCPHWLKHSPERRKMMERSYAMLTNTRIHGSWGKAEQYVHNKDLLMLQYLYDFPLLKWLIPSQDAKLAYDMFLVRESLRRQGFSIYHRDVSDSWWVKGRPTSTIQPTCSASVPPQPKTSALDTAASSSSDSPKPAKENRRLNFVTEVVATLLEQEDSTRKTPPQANDDNHEKPLTAEELSEQKGRELLLGLRSWEKEKSFTRLKMGKTRLRKRTR